jgi:hypothetical protein
VPTLSQGSSAGCTGKSPTFIFIVASRPGDGGQKPATVCVSPSDWIHEQVRWSKHSSYGTIFFSQTWLNPDGGEKKESSRFVSGLGLV